MSNEIKMCYLFSFLFNKMLYITLYLSSFFLQNVLFIRRQNHLNGKEYHYEINWNGMWKMNLLFYIVDFSLVSFSNKYTIKLWFLKKEKKKRKMKSKRVMHFHLWNVHFLFIIDLYSPTLYKWNDQLEKWSHWNENEIWNQMKENGNEPDIIFMCISICVSSCSFLSSNHEHHHISEIDHLVEMDDVHKSLSQSYCPYLRENTMSFLL